MFEKKVLEDLRWIAEHFSIPPYKAFGILFAQIAWQLEEDDGFDALALVNVEGPNEKGMDLFWVDHPNQRVLIGQCKYSEQGKSKPKVSD